MFFNLGRYFMQPSQLDGLLQQPDCTLERIFDADNILQEIKGLGSQKFADFITRHPELYRKMVYYIILIDDEVLRDKKKQIQQYILNQTFFFSNQRYPFMSSEIMGTENTKLIDFLFERSDELDDEGEKVRESLLPTLISFLDQDCLNVTSAGYFAKAFIPIIKRRGYDLWARINEEPQIISNLIKHLDIKHIAEIVEKLILIESQQETQQTYMELRQRLLERIIIFMNQKSHCKEIVDNVSDILCEITSKSMSNIFYNNNEIIPFIDTIKKPELLFSIALKSQSPSTFQVLINLVELMSKEQNRQEDDEVIQEKDYSSFYKLIYELPGVLVQKDIYIQDFENSNKKTVQPFGLGKIKLLKLIHALITTNDENICKVLADNKLFIHLQTITIKYPGNNQIQSYFDKIVRTVIESNQEQVIQALINDANLLGFIATYNTVQNASQEYIGFLTRLSNYLLERGKQFIKDGLNNEKWRRYQEVLAKINEKEKPFLCGIDPKKKPEELDAEEDVTVDQGVLEILRKFNPYKPQGQVSERQEQDAEIIDEEITEEKQEERDLDSQVKQIEQENADNNFNLKNYWSLPIDDRFAEQVLNSYD